MTSDPRTTVASVLTAILDGLDPLPAVEVEIQRAAGLVVARAITSPTALPPEDRSAMDGIVVRASDVAAASGAAPARLALDGASLAGHADDRPLEPGRARTVATGARVPPGADAVVRIEDCEVDGDSVLVHVAVEPGRDLRPAGQDLAEGGVLVPAGRVVDTGAIAGVAGAGVRVISAVPAPRVVVLPTGDEVVSGTTPDAVGPMLHHLLTADGACVTTTAPVPDDLAALTSAVEAHARSADLVVTVGGASVGARDHAGALVAALAQGRAESLALRPGRPFAWGRTGDGVTVLCLPGSPLAALAASVVLVRPVVARLAGRAQPRPRQVSLGAPVEGHPRLRTLVSAAVGADGLARPVPGHGSADLARLAGTSLLLDLPPGTERLVAGQSVDGWHLP